MSDIRSQAVELFNSGNQLYKAYSFKEALDKYYKVIDTDLSFYNAHFWITKTLIELEEFQKGIEYFQEQNHLFPKLKSEKYILQLSKILSVKGKHSEALIIIELLDFNSKKAHASEYASILFSNDKNQDAIHAILSLNIREEIQAEYKKVMTNKNVSPSIVKSLKEEEIIPSYLIKSAYVERLGLIKNVKSKEYYSNLKDNLQYLKQIKEDKTSDYLFLLDKIEKGNQKSQVILAQQVQGAITSKDVSKAEQGLSILTETKYNELKELNKKLKSLKGQKNKKKITLIALATAIAITLSVLGNFLYKRDQRIQAYNKALNSESFNGYTDYLEKYGDDEELHRLREGLLYEIAVKTNNSKEINIFKRLYSQSSYLKTITISVSNSSLKKDSKIAFYGIANDYKINTNQNNSAKIPVGCKIRYTVNYIDKIPIERAFTVMENMTISEDLYDVKTLIFNDDFENNQNGWNVFNENKVIYNRTKNKGVKIESGNLNLYHEYSDNKFVFSTIFLSRIKRNIDFEVVAKIKRNNSDNGTFLMFGATKRAFNYIAYSKNGNYSFGYNNWDKSNEQWVYQSDRWKYSHAVSKGNTSINTIKIIKRNRTLNYSINNTFLGEVPLKKWYGRQIGFGVNGNTNSNVLDLEIYQYNTLPKTTFTKGSIYFCWVDELNVRSGGSTKDEILTTITMGEAVKYLGEIGSKEVSATFKKKHSPEYYYKVELLDGTIGWVHGGALSSLNTQTKTPFEDYKQIK